VVFNVNFTPWKRLCGITQLSSLKFQISVLNINISLISVPLVGGRGCDRLLLASIIFTHNADWLPRCIRTRGSLYRENRRTVSYILKYSSVFQHKLCRSACSLVNNDEKQRDNEV